MLVKYLWILASILFLVYFVGDFVVFSIKVYFTPSPAPASDTMRSAAPHMRKYTRNIINIIYSKNQIFNSYVLEVSNIQFIYLDC